MRILAQSVCLFVLFGSSLARADSTSGTATPSPTPSTTPGPATSPTPTKEPAPEFGTGARIPTVTQLAALGTVEPPYPRAAAGVLRSSVDLTSQFPPPGDQGQDDSCVAWALAYALKSYQESREHGWGFVRDDGNLDTTHVFSPAYIYDALYDPNNPGLDVDKAFDILVNGAATDDEMHGLVLDPQVKPTDDQVSASRPFRILRYKPVRKFTDLTDSAFISSVKDYLSNGVPVVIEGWVSDDFRSLRGPTGRVPLVDSRGWDTMRTTYPNGAHAMVVVGYDDSVGDGAFKVINSYGRKWRDGGFGWIDYATFARQFPVAFVATDATESLRAGSAPVDVAAATTFSADPYDSIQSVLFVNGEGDFFKFSGEVSSAAGGEGTLRIVVRLYFDGGGGKLGAPVPSQGVPKFEDFNGNVYGASDEISIPSPGLIKMPWSALIQIPSIGIPHTQYRDKLYSLLAVPKLYLDGVEIQSGTPIQMNTFF